MRDKSGIRKSTPKKKLRSKGNQPDNPTGGTRAKRLFGVNTKKVRAKLRKA